MDEREVQLDEVGYRRAQNELGSLKETRRAISRSLGTVAEPDRLPRLYADLAAVNERVVAIEREITTKYKELHEAIPIDLSTLQRIDDLPYEISFENRKGYISAMVRAVATPPPVARTIIQEIFTRVRSQGSGRVMIEANIEDLGTEEEIFETMTNLAKTLPGFRIALVNSDAKQRVAMAFAAEVGRQSGHDYKYFNDKGLAEQWLLGWD